jgi:hypothetical protein
VPYFRRTKTFGPSAPLLFFVMPDLFRHPTLFKNNNVHRPEQRWTSNESGAAAGSAESRFPREAVAIRNLSA